MEKNIRIAFMFVVIGIAMIFLGLIIEFQKAQNCNNLPMNEYFEKGCNR